MESKKSWGVIGGGILGMSLAYRLAQEGHRVTLFEAEPQLGGLARAWDVKGFFWDRYYHVILQSDRFLLVLLKELGLENEIKWGKSRSGFYTDGRLFSMSNAVEFLLFPSLNLWNKLRLAFTIFYASKINNWKKLENMPVSDWLRRWSGKTAFEKVWLPLLLAKLGETYKQTSAAFIWATIARMYAARRSGFKKEMFGHISGGYARILDRFEKRLSEEGIRIKTSQPVEKIEQKNPNQIMLSSANGIKEVYDKVIATIPSPISARICPDLTNEERLLLNNLRYVGVICASFLLRQPLSNFYITYITDSSVPFTAVIDMSSLIGCKPFGGNHLVYLPKYADPEDPIFSSSDEDIQDIFFAALSKMYPGLKEEDLVGKRVSRDRYVFAPSTLNYSERVPPVRTSFPHVYFINSAHILNGTLNVNETIRLAENALSEILT